VLVDRLIALERGDYATKSGRDHFMARFALQRLTEPDFIWTPYKDFISPLHDNTAGIAGNWTHTWGPRVTSEFKFDFASDELYWNRAHPEIPTLTTTPTITHAANIPPLLGLPVTLPGSPEFYAYRNRNKTTQAIYSTIFTRDRHTTTVGGGLLLRYNFGYLTAGEIPEIVFSTYSTYGFLDDEPVGVYTSINRLTGNLLPASGFNRNYYYPQFYAFAQDSFRLSSRLTLNYGVRYDNFGGPKNTGSTKDVQLQLGPGGGDFNTELAGATLYPGNGGNETIFRADNTDFAGRFGISWDPFGKSKTVLRAGYGIFYDGPFDNLWQNVRSNNLALVLYNIPQFVTTNYLQPVASVLAPYIGQTRGLLANANFPGITLVDPGLRNGYAQDAFAGVQQFITGSLTMELNGTMSLGRRLITTDIVNRLYTSFDTFTFRASNSLPSDVYWRSSQGKSDYTAMSAMVKYRYRTLFLQGAYTWSHAIDNQSDPLVGDFFDLNFTTITVASSDTPRATFATQFDSKGDRGNSDFDQRQNLFLLGVWQSEGRGFWTRGWEISSLAAFRGGFPYTVSSENTGGVFAPGGVIETQRADVINPAAVTLVTPRPGSGGVFVLNRAGFAPPANANVVGNSGRNAFRGPGLYNIDVSLARSFSIPKLREGTRLTIRADAFNILNHPNLNNPSSLLSSTNPNFGLETFGRAGTASGFPATSPVNETARQIQMLVRIEF
jgi:hypothetical protein